MTDCATNGQPRAIQTAPELSFAVMGARIVADAAVPTLAFRLELSGRDADDIRSVVLTIQIRIASARRAYDPAARGRLTELFGDRAQAPVPQDLLWTHASVAVPPFSGATTVDVPVACTSDMEMAVAKYFQALDEGMVPLDFLFSGSVFYTDPRGALQTCRIGWDRQARFALPVAVWKEMIERHYPDAVWLRLDRRSVDRLRAWKAARVLPTWQATVNALLAAAEGAPKS